MFFISGIFGIAIQIVEVILESPIHIHLSCVIIYEIIAVLELFLCVYTLFYIMQRQGALFNLRNSTIDNQNQREKIKTSQEIEQELFYKFPYLKKPENKINNSINNNNHIKDD